MQYILTDIEGTTTSVSFVYDVLFPYFIEHVVAYAEQHNDNGIEESLEAVKATILEEERITASRDEAIAKLIEWTRNDRKHPALKSVQGQVWRKAFEAGEIKGHVYDDVLPAFKAWTQNGMRIGIYSSGSVEAQQLIFKYSIAGDLTHFISHYFDTGVGHKREATSYKNIQEQLQLPPNEILFLSDVPAELDAAEKAGLRTIQLIREDITPSGQHALTTSFSQIALAQIS